MQQMKNTKITISDLAKALQISTATISRALNDSSLISEEVRKRVQSKAQEMGYVTRPVKKQRDRAILNVKLVLPHRALPEMQLFYDLSELIQGIRQGAGNVKVQLVTLLESETHQIFDHKKGGHVDAVIFAFCEGTNSVYKELKQKNVPFILINRSNHGGDYVLPDTFYGMESLLKTMQENLDVSEKICPLFINLSENSKEVQEVREKAFTDVLESMDWVKGDVSEHVWTIKQAKDVNDKLVQKLLSSDFNVVCCFNDLVATSLIQYLPNQEQNFLIGGYDYSPFVHLLRQKFYTVSMEVKTMGSKAGEWLVYKVIEKNNQDFRENVKGRIIVIE
jgi:LacI family transcriptional regulator